MSRIVTTFASEDAPIQATLARMQKDLDKLVDKNRKLVEESKKGSAAFQGAAADQTKAIGELQKELLKAGGQVQKLGGQHAALTKEIGGNTTATASFGVTLASVLSRGITGVTGLVAGYVSLRGAMQLVSA